MDKDYMVKHKHESSLCGRFNNRTMTLQLVKIVTGISYRGYTDGIPVDGKIYIHKSSSLHIKIYDTDSIYAINDITIKIDIKDVVNITAYEIKHFDKPCSELTKRISDTLIYYYSFNIGGHHLSKSKNKQKLIMYETNFNDRYTAFSFMTSYGKVTIIPEYYETFIQENFKLYVGFDGNLSDWKKIVNGIGEEFYTEYHKTAIRCGREATISNYSEDKRLFESHNNRKNIPQFYI